jgi:hypothetical protein
LYWKKAKVEPLAHAVYMVPLGDMHIGSVEFTSTAQAKLQGYIDWILARPNAVTFLMGDIMNCSTGRSAGRPFEEKLGATDQFLLAKKLLKPLADAGRIMGSIIGNHEWQYSKGLDSRLNRTLELCDAIGIPYCGASCTVTLDVREKGTNTGRVYNLFFTHGFGAGRKRGGKVNNLAMVGEGITVDCYIMGHVHDSLCFLTPHKQVVGGELAKQVAGYSTSGSFLDYEESNDRPGEGYAERLSLPPVSLGAPRILLECDHHKPKNIEITIGDVTL